LYIKKLEGEGAKKAKGKRKEEEKCVATCAKPAPNDAVKMLTASSVERRILQKALKTKSAHKMKAN